MIKGVENRAAHFGFRWQWPKKKKKLARLKTPWAPHRH